jgi:hypothetical protein
MQTDEYKIIKKYNSELARDNILNGINEQFGYNKIYILGEIGMLEALIKSIGKREYNKEDLLVCLKHFAKDIDWAKDMVEAIIKENE